MDKKDIDRFNRIRGEIISYHISIESLLELIISEYFHFFRLEKRSFFEENILYKIRFDTKLSIIKEICKKENFSRSEIERLLSWII